MKRNKKILNANKVRHGRSLARWAAAGMNWGDGPARSALMDEGRRIAANKAACADLYDIVKKTMADIGTHHATQSVVSAAIHALRGDDSWVDSLRES